MQFRSRLSSGRAQLISSVLCSGFLLACSDDSDAAGDAKDSGAAHDSADSSTKTSQSKAAATKADAGHAEQPAADSGSSQADAKSSSADSGAKSDAPASDKKDEPAKASKPEDKTKDKTPESLKVSVRFQARLGKTDFACSHKYPSQGTANTTVTPRDFRLFVHELMLIKEDGGTVPVTLNVREPWQSDSLALLDFEDKTGRCSDGTEGTNTAITGTASPGTYKGLRFTVGVPEALDHKDQASAAEPLKSAAGLGSKTPEGFRFARIALQQLVAAGDAAGSGLFELGSTQCSGTGADAKCDKANRSVVQLDSFDIEKNSVVIDIAALFSTLDLTQANECHSTEKSCDPMFNALGVDFATGQQKAGQTLFKVE